MSKNQNSRPKNLSDNTRKRLLDVAEKLFAEKGFAGTTVRDITSQGHCNIAAINYYFGGKDNLYLQVFHRQIDLLRKVRIDSIHTVMQDERQPPSIEKLLRNFATMFLKSLLDDGGGSHFVQLVTREMLNPHLPREIMINEFVKPVLGAFKEALFRLYPELDDVAAELCIHSTVGQLLHVVRARSFYGPGAEGSPPVLDVPRVIDHIVRFSAAGIRACIEERLNEKA